MAQEQPVMMDIQEILGMPITQVIRKSNVIFDLIKDSVDRDPAGEPVLNFPKAIAKVREELAKGDPDIIRVIAFHAIKDILDNLMRDPKNK